MNIDTTQIESYDELIEIAKSLSSDKERMELLGKYFYENVTYSYEFVDILGQSANYDQQALMEIQERHDVWNPEERTQALVEVREYLKREMAKRFHNEELLEQTLETRMKAISEQYGKVFEAKEARTGKFRMSAQPEKICNLVGLSTKENIYYQGHNLTFGGSINSECGAMRVYKPYVIQEKGLLKNAVCQEYAPWIKKYCDDLGIPCEQVKGKGTVPHCWCLIRFGTDEPIHFDPTNMAFIRDGYGANPTNAEPEEWLGTDIDKMFQMQPGREIYDIGDTKGLMIKSDNYKEYKEAINQMIGYSNREENSLKTFAEKGLRAGVDSRECGKALRAEITKELEGQTQGQE